MTATRAPRRKPDDPLVSVSGAHVRAVLQAARLSERDAVEVLRRRGAHVSKPTLDHIIHGRQVRCRKSLRDGIETLYDLPLPPDWLDGTHDPEVWGPAYAGKDLNLRPGPGSPLGRVSQKLRELAGVPAREDRARLPLYQLIAYGLIASLRKAGAPDDLARAFVHLTLSLTLWQRSLVGDAGVEIIPTEEMNRFAIAAGEALRIALRPALQGDAPVRDGVLAKMVCALEAVKVDVDAAARLQTEDFRREFAREHPDGVSGAAAPPERPLNFGPEVLGQESGKRSASSPRKRAK